MSDASFRPAAASEALGEFWTPSAVEAVNEKLRDLGLDAGAIVAVIFVPADPMVTPEPSQFRVLVRMNGAA